MKNIFDSAEFGDKFRTRDGKKVIYYTRNDFGVTLLTVFGLEHYHNDGVAYHNSPNEDIVSRWQEPIDEEELTEMAECWNINTALCPTIFDSNYTDEDVVEAFKLGYRKAKIRMI